MFKGILKGLLSFFFISKEFIVLLESELSQCNSNFVPNLYCKYNVKIR